MADWLADRTAIVGIGHTAFGKRGEFSDRGPMALVIEAVTNACADAGVSPAEIDGWSSYSLDETEGGDLAFAFGARPVRYTGMTWGGGGAAMGGAYLHAMMAVATGQVDYCVVTRGICQGLNPYGKALAKSSGLPAAFSFAVPYGLMSPAQMFGLSARRHMHRYGTTIDHFAEVTINARRMAANNPLARFRDPITVEEHHASRMMADPIRLLDMCMESDVGVAVLITSTERAQDLRQPPVLLRGATLGSPWRWGQGNLGNSNMRDDDFASAGQRSVAEDLYTKSGLGPADVDVAQIYDHFTPMVLMGLEDFGFCAPGEGGPFVADGNIRTGGSLPLNTSGGNLAEVYSHGMTHVVEGVRQLRGTSCNQVDGAEVCLVVGGAGPTPTSALMLRRSS